MPVGKFVCKQKLANCDSPTAYGMHFPAILSKYNGVRAYICHQFIPTTAFLVAFVSVCNFVKNQRILMLFSLSELTMNDTCDGINFTHLP